MTKPSFADIESNIEIDGRKGCTRYSVIVPSGSSMRHLVVVLVNSDGEVYAVSQDAGKRSADRARAFVMQHIFDNG